MTRRIGAVTLVVRDYDEAKAYYRDALGFDVIEDTALGAGKRWVLVAPPGGATALLLARAEGAAQRARVGDQTGGRVGLFLHTDDFRRDHRRMVANGVRFLEDPREEAYGTVAVFEDLYGNRWDLLEPAGVPAGLMSETRPGFPDDVAPPRRDRRGGGVTGLRRPWRRRRSRRRPPGSAFRPPPGP